MTLPNAGWVAWALRAPSDVFELHALDIDHATWAAPMRLVRHPSGLELKHPLGTFDYEAADFAISPPIADGSLDVSISVVVSSHAPELYRRLALIPSSGRNGAPLSLTWHRYLSTDLSAPAVAPSHVFEVTEAQATLRQVTLEAVPDHMDLTPVGRRYVASTYPWVADLELEP